MVILSAINDKGQTITTLCMSTVHAERRGTAQRLEPIENLEITVITRSSYIGLYYNAHCDLKIFLLSQRLTFSLTVH